MSNEKANYEETKYALSANQPLRSIVNQLTKIAIKTEDLTLKKMIAPTLEKFKAALNLTELKKSIKFKGVSTTDADIKALLDYCDRAINSTKPQWQMIAEQQGWAPREPTK